MIRKIIKINEELCNGCGLCAAACHEGAIDIIEGKARLMRDDYCDGLGDCLPACPTGAITFEEREAAPYNEVAVKKEQAERRAKRKSSSGTVSVDSQLMHWPVQIKLVPVKAPYFDDAKLLIAADCTAFAYGNIHNDFIKDHTVIIGCPKLDALDYSEKLTEIIKNNDIQKITVLRMEVPCCGGMAYAAEKALENSGKNIPLKTIVIGTEGNIILT